MTTIDDTDRRSTPAQIPAQGELATPWLQQAIDRAAAAGGGIVRVPTGVHHTGALRLRSSIELHLEAGATLRFVPDPALYPVLTARWEGAEQEVYSPCLYAEGEHDVAITGFGTIDGQGGPWWDTFRRRPHELAHARPTLIGLHGCERVTLRDLTLRNSPAWTVHPAMCDGVTIQNLRIVNPDDSPNTDGIDPESCRNVHISDCHIDVGDDCIAIKAGTEHGLRRIACENIVITGCTMVRGHGGVVIGSEMSGGVRNVAISNCVFQGTDRGIRLKTRRGRGGIAENIRVTNVVMDDVLCPVTVNSFYHCGPDGKQPWVGDRSAQPVDSGTPRIRGLRLAQITASRVHASAAHIYGLPESPLRDVSITDMHVTFAEHARAAKPEMAEGIEQVTRGGVELGHVLDGELSGVRVVGARGAVLTTQDCHRTELDVRGRDDHDD